MRLSWIGSLCTYAASFFPPLGTECSDYSDEEDEGASNAFRSTTIENQEFDGHEIEFEVRISSTYITLKLTFIF